jgi:hypothetical protein
VATGPEAPPRAATPWHAADALEVQSAAQSIGRQLLVLKAGSPQAIDSAFATLVEQRAGALLVGGDPFLVGRSQQLVAMAARHAIPAIYDFRESVLLGGLMSYGSNLPNNYRQLGVYAGRILKGESTARNGQFSGGSIAISGYSYCNIEWQITPHVCAPRIVAL